jgi:glycerol-3-phosphate dehydrogenase
MTVTAERPQRGDREATIDACAQCFDVAIIGGGISGACLYDRMCREGYRVLLVDRADFGSGTSQASAMMIWGGLLYLRQFDFGTVWKLSGARDDLIVATGLPIRTQRFRYIPALDRGHNAFKIRAALWLYWLLGRRRRCAPSAENTYPEQAFMRAKLFGRSHVYEEGVLETSDCRFVLEWILPHRPPDHCALNYCALESAAHRDSRWHLELVDRHLGGELKVSAKMLVNAAGVWTDRIHQLCGLTSPYKHVFSKGVFIAIPRPAEHDDSLIFDMGEHGDGQTFHPWGPVSLWGPTETAVDSPESGFRVAAGDVRFLLAQANKNLNVNIDASDIVSLRCGIRPLAVKRGYSAGRHPLDCSRKHLVHHDRANAAIAIYGGKLTSCRELASEIMARLKAQLRPSGTPNSDCYTALQGADKLAPEPSWCRDNELCLTLDDYLRRRSNIAQWVPRRGLGRDDSNLDEVRAAARAIEGERANAALERYRSRVREEYDALLASV